MAVFSKMQGEGGLDASRAEIFYGPPITTAFLAGKLEAANTLSLFSVYPNPPPSWEVGTGCLAAKRTDQFARLAERPETS
jgi:hypothetical protein